MSHAIDTVLDRYIRIFDRAPKDHEALEELRTIFAPDATVQLHQDAEAVTGLERIMELYRAYAEGADESRHVWDSTELADGTIECRWVAAARATDGRLSTLSGLEHATVNADGLITNLRNKMVPAESL